VNNQSETKDALFVILGITGDLSKRKLLPALYELEVMGLLGQNFRLIGTSRRGTTVENIETIIRESIENVDEACLRNLLQRISIAHMDISQPDDFRILTELIDSIESKTGACLNRLFYLAVPPEIFQTVVNNLGAAGLHKNCQHGSGESRLLVEKPFGSDVQSSQTLIAEIEKTFKEDSVYRVDHYLAKETVQNILTFRTQNPVFRAIWNKDHVHHIMITASETLGIEGRVNFYENTGALRDLIQSHLLQLLTLVTMDEPEQMTAEAIHIKKQELLKSITPIPYGSVDSQTVRGQYEGYKAEVQNDQSATETYAAIKLEIQNDRWRSVPLLLRTGKSLSEKVTEITLVFKHSDLPDQSNMLTIRIQPNEGIVLSFLTKKPSLENQTETVQMEFCYNNAFSEKQPDAYERVLVDAIRGDKTLFMTDSEVTASWAIIQNILQRWSEHTEDLLSYEQGSWGPEAGEALAQKADATWLTGQLNICPVKTHP
jgi:glucose-6-phosphate 1-dehydrogenase